VRAHIDTLMKKKIEQWEPTCSQRSVSSILYFNAMSTCSKGKMYIYICVCDGWRILLIKDIFLIYIVLFSCLRLVQLIHWCSTSEDKSSDEHIHSSNKHEKQYTGTTTVAEFRLADYWSRRRKLYMFTIKYCLEK